MLKLTTDGITTYINGTDPETKIHVNATFYDNDQYYIELLKHPIQVKIQSSLRNRVKYTDKNLKEKLLKEINWFEDYYNERREN